MAKNEIHPSVTYEKVKVTLLCLVFVSMLSVLFYQFNLVEEVSAQTDFILGPPIVTGTRLIDPRGATSDVPFSVSNSGGVLRVELDKPERQLRPGKYRLQLDLKQGDISYKTEQTFTWGVLAINTNKATYRPGETAYLQMASLNDYGHTLCDSSLLLTLTSPSGLINTFETSNGTITQSDTCGANNVTDNPDYWVRYTVGEEGEYLMRLENIDVGYLINDSFMVGAREPFYIERSGATRINPFMSTYRMDISIESPSGFTGKITEEVPKDFIISNHGGASISQKVNSQTISWDVELGPGQKKVLGYVYQAPKVSPQLFFLGPVVVSDRPDFFGFQFGGSSEVYTEARQWQLASDATQVIEVQRGVADIGNSGGTQTAPTNFTAFAATTSAFVLNTNNRYMNSGAVASAANQEVDDMSGAIELTATNTISFHREAASANADYRFHWESWEYTGPASGINEFIVRGYFNASIVTTARTGTDTVEPCGTRDNCIPFITGIMNGDTTDDADEATAVCWMSADGTVTCERGGQSDTTEVYGVVVEFTGSNWRVGHGRTGDVTGDTGTISLFDESVGTSGGTSFSVNDWSNALIFHQFKGDDSANNQAIVDTSATYVPGTGNNQVDWYFDAGHDASDNQHMVHVLENPLMGVTRFSDTGSAQGDNNIDITSAGVTNLGNTTITGSSNSSGTGTAYGRGWKGIYLTTTTNASAWAHRSGNTISTEIQVAKMPLGGAITNQIHYRWRDDTTDLNTSGGWLAAEDTKPADITKNTTYRLRMEVANSGGVAEAAARTYELQWGNRTGFANCSDISTWTGVANSADEFDMVLTTHIDPDGESTTAGLLANTEGYTRVNGEGRESADTTGSIGPLSADNYTELEYSIEATDDAVTGGSYCFRLYDTTAAAPIDLYSKYPRVTIKSVTIPGAPMEWGVETGVASTTWSTINFDQTFVDPVFLCTVQYDNNIGAEPDTDADSVVCRVQNVGATSAQVRLQVPGGLPGIANTESVHWMAIEAGTYDSANIKMEAFTYTSTVTDDNGSYIGQSQTYSQSYTTPVVLGQVMTYNDPDWSVFYAMGSTQTALPSSSVLNTGKHVGEDSDITRANETLGVVVIEQDNGALGGIEYEAFQPTGGLIDRIDDNTTNTLTFNEAFSSTPAVGIVSQTAISGADGPHPELYGSSPLTTTTIQPTIMEDEIVDGEMGGNTEDVAYMVFESSGTTTVGQIALDQTTYRFYENIDAIQPTTPIAAQNTAITDVADTDIVRIRMAVQVGLTDLATSTAAFKLQHGEGSNCSGISMWNDVGGVGSTTAIWRGYDNTGSGVTDGATTTASLLNSQTNALESYEESNNSASNLTFIETGTRGEWDWVVQNNGATGSTDYCFRMVTSDDSVILYTKYPQLTTLAVNSTPTISSLSLNGNSNINLTEGTYKWASSTMKITDADGCDEVATTTGGASVSATLFHASTTNSGTTCTQNDNSCYPAVSCQATSTDTCTPGGSDQTVDYECGFKLWYIANPTDAGAPREDDIWTVAATTTDISYATSTATNTGQTVDINSLFALDVAGFLDYATTSAGGDTGSDNDIATTTNTGNTSIDVNLGGDNLKKGADFIPTNKQKFNTTTFTYSSGGTHLTPSTSPIGVVLDLAKPTATTTAVEDLLYWGIGIPSSQPSGTYTGLNYFNAVADGSGGSGTSSPAFDYLFSDITDVYWDDSGSTAVKIDDASDFQSTSFSGRQLVRTSGGNLYAFVEGSSSCEIWKSSDGTSWTEQGSNNNPGCVFDGSMAIDSNDTLHLAYGTTTSSGSIYYNTFNTGTDTFGIEQSIHSVAAFGGPSEISITVDSNDKPHVVWNDEFIFNQPDIEYSNKVGASWKTPIKIESGSWASDSTDITINEDNEPELTYSKRSAGCVAGLGDANDPTTFSTTTPDNTANTSNNSCSIAVDSGGNTWIGYLDENGGTDYISLIKHNDADGWSTWQTPVNNTNNGLYPSIAIDGTTINVLYEENVDNDIVYDSYNGSAWGGETLLEAGTYQVPKVKWQYLNNN